MQHFISNLLAQRRVAKLLVVNGTTVRVVLADSPPSDEGGLDGELPRRGVGGAAGGAAADSEPTYFFTIGSVEHTDPVVTAYRDDPMVIKRAPAARLGATALAVLERAWGQFPDWQVPVLVVHGDADRLVPVEGSRQFIEAIAAEDKALKEFLGGYHELLNDHDREAALETILSWLGARIPA